MNENKVDDNQNSSQETNDFEFLKEKIKERPIDKKKLVKRIALTASLALLFGIIACLTFLLLEPVLNNWLYPEEEPQAVSFPEEKEEILPSNMLSEENGKIIEDESNKAEEITEEIADNEMPEAQEERLIQYENLYNDLFLKTQDIRKSMVTVTGVSSDVDWFNNTYESEGQSAGLIIANNGKELIILCNDNAIKKAQSLSVTFVNQANAEAVLKKSDANTNLAVVAVSLKDVSQITLEDIQVAVLGNSNDDALLGKPIIAIGQINGYTDSTAYGMLSSYDNIITLADNEYKLMTTDIYSSKTPSGILVDMQGEVIGIIKNDYNLQGNENMLSAIGISELKGMITKLSNDIEVPYLGLYSVDVPDQIQKLYKVPQGAYVTDIDMDSPAMKKGIQKGDVIVEVGDKAITNAGDYMDALRQYLVDKTVELTVLRPSQNDYQEMTFELMIETKK